MKYDVGSLTITSHLLRYIAKIIANIRFPFSKSSRNLFKDTFIKDTCGNIIYKRVNKDSKECYFDSNDIPIFIISFNNLTYLKNTISTLEKYKLKNIHVIDNHSDYVPLLEYLNNLPYKVHMMDKNWGHRVLWDSHLFDDVIFNQMYVVTDPDLEFNPELPDTFIYHMYKILLQFPNITKVGFAIRIDDLPKNELSDKIIKWEKKYWELPQEDELYKLYRANVDTTFALYRPGKIRRYNFYTGLRIAGSFCARHLPWYGDSAEGDYYRKTASSKSASWTKDSTRYDS